MFLFAAIELLWYWKSSCIVCLPENNTNIRLWLLSDALGSGLLWKHHLKLIQWISFVIQLFNSPNTNRSGIDCVHRNPAERMYASDLQAPPHNSNHNRWKRSNDQRRAHETDEQWFAIYWYLLKPCQLLKLSLFFWNLAIYMRNEFYIRFFCLNFFVLHEQTVFHWLLSKV